MRPVREGLMLDPCIPTYWDGFSATRKFRGFTIDIEVKNPNKVNKGVSKITLNGEEIKGNIIPEVKLQAGENSVVCVLG